MRVVTATHGKKILLGRCGENMASCVVFDISEWQRTYGDGTAQLIHQRNGDKLPYPCVIERDGSTVTWNISNSDVAVAGRGRAEIQYYVGDALVKSDTYYTMTDRALGTASETPPEPFEIWMDNMLGLAAETQENAEKAEEAAQIAQEAKNSADIVKNLIDGAADSAQAAAESEASAAEYAESAKSSQEAVENLSATGDLVPGDSSLPLVEKTVDEDGSVNLHFNVRQGFSGVYVGSGDMPEWCNVQVDPNGDPTDMGDIVDLVMDALPTYHGEVEDV